METLCHEAHPNPYAWSKLIDRLAIRNASNSQKAALETAIRNIRSSISTNNILGFTDLLSCAGHLVPSCVHETVSLLAPVYKSYFRQYMNQELEIFDFHFFLTICGINLLGGHRSTLAEKNSAATIVAALPEAELAAIISDSLPRNWQRIHEVLFLISKYDREKAKRIILAIDLNQLSMRAKDAWADNQDIDRLCVAIYLGSPSTARRFIEMNKDKITTVYSVFVGITPKCTSALFRKGIPLDLIGDHRWGVSAWGLRALLKADEVVAKAALSDSCSEIVKQLNQLSAHSLEDDGCVQFLKLMQQYAPDAWKEITNQMDSWHLTHFWDNYSASHSKKKGVEKRLQQLIEMFETESHRQG